MKKIFTLLILAALAFGIYYGYKNFVKPKIIKEYTVESELRDKALSNLDIKTTTDHYTTLTYITAIWSSEVKTNFASSSVKMEIIATETESAKGKKIITSSSMKGITAPGTNNGSLSCPIKQNEITSERPYVWIKISPIIDGKPQPPIIKLLGKFNK